MNTSNVDASKLGRATNPQKYVSASESLVSGYVVNESYNVDKEQEASLSLWTPISTPSNAFVSSGTFFDTEITSESYVHFLSDLWLEMTVQNSNPLLGATIFPVPARWLVQRVEIYMGSNLLQQFYSEELWEYLTLSYGNEQLSNLSPAFTLATADRVENFNPTTLGSLAVGLAPQATTRICLMMPKTILHSSVFLPTISGGRVKIRVYLNGGASCYTTADSGMTLQATRWIGTGYRLQPAIFQKVYNYYAQNKVISRFAYSRRQVTSVSTSIGSEFQFPLNSFLGSFSFFTFWQRLGGSAGPGFGANQYNMIPVSNWSLINSSGQPVYSSTQLPQYIFSSMIQSSTFPSFGGSVANGQQAIFSFSQSPFQALQMGLNYGNLYSNGLFTLRGTSTVAGAYDIICVGSELALCAQDGGQLIAYYL